MSRYAVTYRIDGGPGFSGWAERTCNSVNVYANKDDMTPVAGATIVTYSDVPTEVHVVPTTKDCNGAGSVSVYDRCAVDLLAQIERNTRMLGTEPTEPTPPPPVRSMFIVDAGKKLDAPITSRNYGISAPAPYAWFTRTSFDADGKAQFSAASDHTIRSTAEGDVVRFVVPINDQELTEGISLSGAATPTGEAPRTVKLRAAVSTSADYVFDDAQEPFYDAAFSGEDQLATTQLTGNAPLGHYAIVEIMGRNVVFYDGSSGAHIVSTQPVNAGNKLVKWHTYAFVRVNPADDFTNVGAPAGANSGVFTATSDWPNQWMDTFVWDITHSMPSIAYNTTGVMVTADVVVGTLAEPTRVGIRIVASEPLFALSASTVQSTNGMHNTYYDMPLEVVSGTEVLAPLGGKVLYELMQLDII